MKSPGPAAAAAAHDGPVLASSDEGAYAAWCERQGLRVVQHGDRFWREGPRGFYNALHWLSRMSDGEARRPRRACWGFRTTLAPHDAGRANAALPLHLRSDVHDYGLERLRPRDRTKVRRCLGQARIFALADPGLLLRDGHGVARSAFERHGYGDPGSPDEYRRRWRRHFEPLHGLVLVATVDEHLAGYVSGHAVGRTAYLDEVCLATEWLPSNVGLGLFHEWMLACARAGTIDELVHSPHLRERPGLCRHKRGLGFEVVRVPARVWFLPPIAPLVMHTALRRLRPHAYYRLYGRD